ncbi:cobyric acid synthase [Aquabacterium sp. OR-4]|uniref:cobyric acid synthase n=1 Tax=Aquabacterium sp. OR-4 TaxID=2978127 RepID=UPI0021B42D9C|nr:cobyric acid synthase [Aquabacterium sp. OR-4]MDT7836118.1 cobyric acid synthase [Aquabacterium sp. OR-4]
MSRAKAVAVLGCTSGAGKSWITTALCRWYARRGLDVRPFKAQNMSNHARVVVAADGRQAEIGSAQYFQALAAGTAPEPRHNPVLLKPEADTRSQVVLMGQLRPDLAAMPWRERSALLWPTAQAALQSLQAEAELLVIEGAGSPAEINLAAHDYVNTFTTVQADAAALLVADIDRGGAFAHLLGTTELADAGVRQRLRGYLLNKFRGDAALLAPAPELLRQRTGLPVLGVLPLLRQHGLPEEDAVPLGSPASTGPRVVLLSTPHASNLDEFEPVARAGLPLVVVRDGPTLRAALAAPGAVLVLPGSKHTRADLAWVRQQGLDAPIAQHVAAGQPLLAVCGALQWLGRVVDDPLGQEGGTPGQDAGLGLLPLHTRFAAHKTLRQARHRLGALQGPWAALSGLAVLGYEIHLGHSQVDRQGALLDTLLDAAPASPGLGWQRGPILAVYLHGLFENPAVLQALFGRAPEPLATVFDRLADTLDEHVGAATLMGLLEAR